MDSRIVIFTKHFRAYSICLLLTIITRPNAHSQGRLWSGLISPNTDNSVYTTIQNMWFANEKPSYFCFLPYYHNRLNPTIPLRDGEGDKEWNILDGDIYHQLPIAMGRNHGTHARQTSRLTFDYGFNKRIVKGNSSPLLPSNNIFGLSFFKSIWNSYIDRSKIWDIGPCDTCETGALFYAYDNFAEKQLPLSEISVYATVNHYSNGQPPNSLLKDTINNVPLQRNDYLRGDFSTNYFRIGCTGSYLTANRNLISGSIGYQCDFAIGNVLSYTPVQEGAYGHHRLRWFIQYRRLSHKTSTCARINDYCSTDSLPCTYIKYYRELVFRWDSDLILDDVSMYNQGKTKPYKLGQHFYIYYTQPNWRALGLILHLYAGRDYSNIRYDMPIFAAMGGISVNFNKYSPTFSNNQKGLTNSNCPPQRACD